MFRFLFTWSLEITGASIVGYHFLPGQKQANIYGAYRSLINSSRASIILGRSVYDYYHQLSLLPYNTEEYHEKRSEIHTRVAKRILHLSQTNKGIYLKLGQYLGNLEKVVPWEFTEVLKVLQDSGPSVSYEDIKVVIEEDLKKSPKDIFYIFGKKAFAAASLAQVHKAELASNFREVAVKIQFPFLRTQSKWDLSVLRKITNFCNYLMIKWDYKEIDLLKLFDTWTSTLVEELDFERQVTHAQKTRQLFKNNPHVYVPKIYKQYCTDRIIVMEYINGPKISEPEKIEKMGIDKKKVAKNLINIFSTMIFKHGYVHCDAHPGNLLIRKNPTTPMGHQIVLLDHGLYREISQDVRNDFSQLWKALVLSDKANVEKYAHRLNIHKHIRYLPIIFLMRTVNSTKKLGAPLTQDQRKYMRQEDIANFSSINHILQDLPPELMFIIRATGLIAVHNRTLGGSRRDRLIAYTQASLANCGVGWSGMVWLAIRVWLLENFHGFYKFLFGTLA